MRHDLKTYPEFFNAILDGRKTFEVRRLRDTMFQEGDTLLLQEYEPSGQCFTGSTLRVLVTYVLLGGRFGIEQGYCVMGIKVSEV